ncbi:hypothetical protein M3175_04325 [Robertmurraya korlensis]|uniref:hypothetical protein n=1 Tax=Robertmurraya korlensis TaxID=519977 RepID=UPI00203B1D1B|nr:hypothetical protein [Robertmurraya korlensis]MCM3599947.1 hypothetical protein [Robertmurraya korlensis]
MKIHNYYHYAAITSLHASIVALIPPFLLVCIGVTLKQHQSVLLLTLPFIVYSFISYQIFLVNKHRMGDSDEPVIETTGESIVGSSMAIQFLPAPSLRMLLFNKNGQLSAEIKDLYQYKFRWLLPYFIDQFFPKTYTFSKSHGGELYTFILKGKNILIMNNMDDKCIASIQRKSIKRYVVETNIANKEVIVQSSSFFMDIKLYNSQGEILARVRRGFLPRIYDKHIKDENTPILTFSEEVTDLDKVILLSILTKIYRYRNH